MNDEERIIEALKVCECAVEIAKKEWPRNKAKN